MEINIAVAKRDKYLSQGSGDTLEIIERPNGGISLVMADGKMQNHDSKQISNKVAHHVINLIGEGKLDGAAVRSAAGMLFHEFSGHAQASLSVLSCDCDSETLIITQVSRTPVVIFHDNEVRLSTAEHSLIGMEAHLEPTIAEFEIEPGTSIIMFTEGIMLAGHNQEFLPDLRTNIQALFEEQAPTSQEIADFLLIQAVGLDKGEPENDMCVAVLQILPDSAESTRYMTVKLPLT